MPPSTTATNPQITREIVAALLVKPLEAASVFLASGVRVFDSDGSPVRVPRLDGMTAAPTWVAEGEVIPDTTRPNTSEVVLLPRSLKSLKTISRFSRELSRQSVVSLDAALRDRLVRDIAATFDVALFTGDGDIGPEGRTTPLGLINQPGVQTVAVGGPLTFDAILDAIAAAMLSNVDLSRLTLFVHPASWVALRRAKDGDDRFQLSPDPSGAPGMTVMGVRVVVTSHLPVGNAVLGDMSTVAIGRDLNPSVTVLSELYAATDEIGLKVVARLDSVPLLPAAIVVLEGITA